MTIREATEVIRELAQELMMDDFDFSNLTFGLLVDDRPVTVEYLAMPDVFLVSGPVLEGVDLANTAMVQAVLDYAHMSAISGGGALTLDAPSGRVVYSRTVARTGLTVDDLGSVMGEVSDGMALYAKLINFGGFKSEKTALDETYTLRL